MKEPKRIKSVVADLDNTLINHFGDISSNNSAILRQLNASDVVIGLATGRNAQDVARQLDFWHLGHAVSFIIGSNGCDYLNLRNRKLVKRLYLNYSDLEQFDQEFDRERFSWGVRVGNRFYLNKITFWSLLYCAAMKLKPVTGGFEKLKKEKFSRIVILGSPGQLKKLFSTWNLKDFKAMPIGKYTIEVVHPQISKYEGLNQAMEDFDLRPEEVMTFGDDYNDIELLRRTEGIAMKNAVDPLVEVSRCITKYSGAQDGVAYHLNAALIGSDYVFGPELKEAQDQPVLKHFEQAGSEMRNPETSDADDLFVS